MHAETPHEKIYTVTEVTREIRGLLEGRFPAVWVEGEVSNLRAPGVGHLYFTLKDESSQIRAVMFKGRQARLRFSPENGLSVMCYGSVSVYEPKGEYQIIVEYMEPQGIGALQLAFEQLREKLRKEGLFDEGRKKPIPLLPQRIGVVTSPTGAALHDILHIINRRYANVHLLLYPVRVQGEGAADEIAEGVRALNDLGGIDVIIVARGGGSLEDLWAFNEEVVARAIFASGIPVISAVGHEVDYTISDFVADLRAPTPSAAAELVVQKKEDLEGEIEALFSRIVRAMMTGMGTMKGSLARAVKGLRDPLERLRNQKVRCAELHKALRTAIQHSLEVMKKEMEKGMEKLDALSPLAILKRGYSITFALPDMTIVKDAGKVKRGDSVRVKVHKGEMTCSVEETKK